MCPYLAFKYENTFNNAMFKWFWTIFSLGAPGRWDFVQRKANDLGASSWMN